MPDVEEQFHALSATWRSETVWLSSVSAMTAHPTYRQIVALGEPVVPLLIEDLRERPEHWFLALATIVGEDHGAGATTMVEASRRWVAWWDSH